jgi:hypothetical protein
VPGAVVFLGICAIALFKVMPAWEALAGFADPIVWLVLCALFKLFPPRSSTLLERRASPAKNSTTWV